MEIFENFHLFLCMKCTYNTRTKCMVHVCISCKCTVCVCACISCKGNCKRISWHALQIIHFYVYLITLYQFPMLIPEMIHDSNQVHLTKHWIILNKMYPHISNEHEARKYIQKRKKFYFFILSYNKKMTEDICTSTNDDCCYHIYDFYNVTKYPIYIHIHT